MTRSKTIRTVAVALSACLAVSCVGQIQIYIDSPTPAKDIAHVIGARFGVPVTFEGTLQAPCDLPRRNWSVLFEYDEQATIDEVLKSAVDELNSLGGDTYAVRKTGGAAGVYGLIPIQTVHGVTNVLDKQVALNEKSVSCEDVLQDLFQQLSLDLPFYMNNLDARPYGKETRRQGTGREMMNALLQRLNDRGDHPPSSLLTWRFHPTPIPRNTFYRVAPPVAEVALAAVGGNRFHPFGENSASRRFDPNAPGGVVGAGALVFAPNHVLYFVAFGLKQGSDQSNKMFIRSGRPYSSVAKHLQKTFPVVVTYEEPPSEFRSHYWKLGTEECQIAETFLDLNWDPSDSPQQILKAALNARVRRSGELKIEAGSELHIVPMRRPLKEAVEGKSNIAKLVECSSKIGDEIDFPAIKGTFASVVKQCLSKSKSFEKEVTVLGDESILKQECVLESGRKTTRTAIEECRTQIPGKASWQLLFSPKTLSYEFHVYLVEK